MHIRIICNIHIYIECIHVRQQIQKLQLTFAPTNIKKWN